MRTYDVGDGEGGVGCEDAREGVDGGEEGAMVIVVADAKGEMVEAEEEEDEERSCGRL